VADKMVLGRVGGPFAPAQKISRVKRDHGDPNRRRFERQLMEEDKEKGEDTVEVGKDIQNRLEWDGDSENLVSNNAAQNAHSAKDSQAAKDMPPGSVVDICV
jgi:hypothetical protein